MKNATYTVDKHYTISAVDRRMFGSFVEHLGKVVYDGIFEPGHPEADEQGFRKDAIAAVKEAGITLVRYPGGNFVSGYRWTDGIGPVAERKRRLDLAWSKIEPNLVGVDEFADWTKKTGVEFMAAVNLGTGTPQEAGEMVEYCNLPSGTYWSELRQKNGHAEPHQIKLWCLGNEMDGDWQIGQLSAEDYGKKAREAAKIMKWTDPSIELVACGSCNPDMVTYPDWDRIVLEHVYDQAEYISLHRYYSYDLSNRVMNPNGEEKGDAPYFAHDLADYLHTVIAAADLVKTKKRSAKSMFISFDEWNVLPGVTLPAPEGQRGEWLFTLREVLVYGSFITTFLKHADRVKVACQSLMINAGGFFATRANGIVKNPTFTPFQQMARCIGGAALLDQVNGPVVPTTHHGDQPALQTAAVYQEQDGELYVIVVNFDEADDILLKMDLRSFDGIQMTEHTAITGSLDDYNHPGQPDMIRPAARAVQTVSAGCVDVIIPKSSWNMLRFSTSPKHS